ncbi:hypothetical protein Bhyg_03572 [Pseudolycoriella hygida]|uniref:Uncharacterized protein n=1 Tax=Pseudolycoriella hygida TaxID=35572 RepID=A0A9Q0NDN0_9DIPT|nr:hypothetical protein Bhyg_03572 [Pseudolycoriella hygida]
MDSQQAAHTAFNDCIALLQNQMENGVDVGANIAAFCAQLKQLSSNYFDFRRLDLFLDRVQANTRTIDIRNCEEEFTKILRSCPRTNEVAKLANDVVVYGAFGSIAIIALQTFALRNAWAAIKDAQNLVESSKDKISLIDSNINLIGRGLSRLQSQEEKWRIENTADRKRRLINAIRTNISRLNKLVTKTRIMMSELKVNVNGKQEALKSIVIGNAVSSGLKILEGCIVAAFASLAATNFAFYNITQKELAALRDILNIVTELEVQLNDIDDKIDAVSQSLFTDDGFFVDEDEA